MKVLVCLRYGIGDLVMELPALGALRSALPDASVTGLAAPPAHELLEGDPRVDRLVLTSRWSLEHRWDAADEETRGAIARWILAEGFDRILDVGHATDAVARAIRSLGVATVEGDDEAERRAVLEGRGGVAAIRAGVREGWGVEVPEDAVPELRLRGSDRRFAEALLRDLGAADGPPLAVSPVASHGLKRWPLERFAAVADHLAARHGGPVLVLEGPQQDAGRRVVEAMEHPDAARRVGAHHLLRTAALLERCRAFVCNDTGLMHMAAAVGAPVVGVFGPTRGPIFLPPGSHTAAADPAGLECAHRETETLFPPECWLAGHCLIAEEGCIHRTRLEDVIGAVDGLLARTAGRGADLAAL